MSIALTGLKNRVHNGHLQKLSLIIENIILQGNADNFPVKS